jgi:hypothetical protein
MIEKEPQKSVYEKPMTSKEQVEKVIDHTTIQSQSMLNSKYELLTGYIDGELTQQEAQKVMLLLESEPDYKQLYDEMMAMRQEVQSLSLQDSELEHLDKLFQEPITKTTRIFGFALVAVSSVIFIGFILFSVLINAAIGVLLKVLITGLCLGSLFLLFSVLRQRMNSAKNDKYKRVKL